MNFLRISIVAGLALLLFACKKDPGPGGLATIKGKVFGTDVTGSGNVKDSGYIGDTRVYIAVAGKSEPFEDVRTSYDGTYEFPFLRKGSYDVWAFGECDTCNRTQMFDLKTVRISGKRETVIVEDLRIIY